jgi:hypothetical protein
MARDPDFLHEHFLAGLTQQELPPLCPGQHHRPLDCSGDAAGGPAPAQQGPWAGPQQHQPSTCAAGIAGRAGSGLLSGPSSSGPTPLASAWLFPPVVPGARLLGHSDGHVGDAGLLGGSQACKLGVTPGQGSISAAPAGADTSTAGSSSSLEQQLQQFSQQQAALRVLSGFGAGPVGLRMSSTLAYNAGLPGPMLEAHLEVDGAEEETVSSHSNAVANSSAQEEAFAAVEQQGGADQAAATGTGGISAVAAQEPCGSAPLQPGITSTQPRKSAGVEAAAVDATCCAATQGSCHSASGCNSACGSRLASVGSGGSFAALTQDLIETMLATSTPGPAPQVGEMGLQPTGLAAEAAVALRAPALAVDAVLRIVKPATQQEDPKHPKQKAAGQACSHAKQPTSPCKSPSFKEAFSCFKGLKGRVLSPSTSAGKAAMSAAAAAACAANPAIADHSRAF